MNDHLQELTIAQMLEASSAGGPSTLTSVTRLEPAAGPHASVAPARYVKGSTATYVYEDRFIDGECVMTVLIDSKSSVANRMEAALDDAITDGVGLIASMPRIEVTYRDGDWERNFRCLTLPHRAYDAHIRSGTIDGVPTTQTDAYIRARNADPSSALDMANTSFATVAFGGWDSSRRSRQARFPSVMVGEIIGVLANQDADDPRPAAHSGARVDPVAMGFDLDKRQIADIVGPQQAEYSPKLLSKSLKPSQLGLGAIPPQADGLAGIATRAIIRSHVLSFALLRRMRFGAGPEGDVAIRTLVAALLLSAMARSDSELVLRANCHLTEASPSDVRLDQRYGESLAIAPLTVAHTDALLEQAYDLAKEHGIDWSGVSLHVEGNPIIVGALDDVEDNG